MGLGNADNTADSVKVVASAAKLTTARSINGVAFDGTSNISVNAVDATARIATSEKGAVNGVATLDATGKVPAGQLPSYVDDVLEFANLVAFPATGETGKIYTAIDSNKIYRWGGTVYVEISPVAGNADTATKLITPRTISATGDATWSATFDGSANVTGALTLETVATAGTYRSVTVSGKGLVTSGTNPTTLAGYGITDAAPLSHNHLLANVSDASAFGRSFAATASAASGRTLLELDVIDGGSF